MEHVRLLKTVQTELWFCPAQSLSVSSIILTCCESKSKISDKVKKIRNTVVTFREDFEENLRSLLADPDKQVAIHLKRNLQLRERWLFPRKSQKTAEPTAFYREEQEKSLSKTKPTPPRSMSEPGIRAVGSEKWTLVTPVPPLKCRCYTQRISAPILSTEEIQAVEREKKDLQYQMLTLDARVMRNLKWKMDDYLPGYKKRVASVSIAAAPTPVRMTAPRTASRTDVFERLSTSGRRFRNLEIFHGAELPFSVQL
ncbi:uncharacterized protein LOC120374436 [Mauremys reevesii]|uniref:uncharacterized protein LOC120374436 n=1 Tax=Mauremys reevesii TaxID=260615 RepID=UPI00193F086E|nr:uncharacterized protein LOC120374436 [Mauremys reevesii]